MIRIKDFSFSYEEASQNNNLKNINLHIKKGECVLLVGQSGSGKTTLSRAINGLIPHFYEGITSGVVEVDNVCTKNLSMVELSKKVGSVFQNPRSQFFNLDTITEIAFGLENHGLNRDEIHKRVSDTVRDLGIENLMGKEIFALSGGQKQIIAIASTYALGSDIFVLDEPSANLDFEAIQHLATIIKRLKDMGKTIVISEHRVYYLKEVFDRCIYVEDGQIKHDYSREEYFLLSKEKLKQLGLRNMSLENLQLSNVRSSKTLTHTISVENICAKYKKSNNILKNVTFDIKSGEATCIIGKNGAGKSTLANVLCGLMKQKSGVIKNEKILKQKDRVGNFYLIMQESSNQLFSDTVLGELQLSFDNSNHYEKDLIELLKLFSLDKYIDRHPLSLSGGERQRLAIITSIVSNSDVIIFDEPTSGLDYNNMMKVKDVIEKLKALDKHIMIITHDYEFILQISDNIAVLDKGEITQAFPLDKDNISKLKKNFIKERVENYE